jgi:prepilin-type N-terminal cleavage/methylation domain-containing protein
MKMESEKRSASETQGFTLIEIMIVTLIITVIVAIAVPSLLRARIQADEATVIGDLRTISQAQTSFFGSHQTFGSFDALTTSYGDNGPPFLDTSWSEGVEKVGYRFSVSTADSVRFVCFAEPTSVGLTGANYYRVDSTGMIRRNPNERPSQDDPVAGS